MSEDDLRIQLSWEAHGDALKSTKLHRALFGRKTKVKGQVFFYDGILKGWKNGRKVKLVDYDRFGPVNLSLPANLKPQVKKLFDVLDIDVRMIHYDRKNNYYRKTYGHAEDELGASSSEA